MTTPPVPRIFAPNRRAARLSRAHARAHAHAGRTDVARFVWDEMADDVIERLAFVRHEPENPALVGAIAPTLQNRFGDALTSVDLESPWQTSAYDFIAVLGMLDAVNDLPGALIHIRDALVPGGLAIASFIGGGSLPRLRAAMMQADGDKPAARIHPMVDQRAAPGLLQRAGWKDPVVDTHTLKVRYPSLDRLVHDLRDQGLGNALCDAGTPLGREQRATARSAFMEQADDDGKVTETFEIVTLTGRRSLAGT